MALAVFLVAGLLAYKHDPRRYRAFAEDRLRGIGPQRAGLAIMCGMAHIIKCAGVGRDAWRRLFWRTFARGGLVDGRHDRSTGTWRSI
jgi:hypothetical protein